MTERTLGFRNVSVWPEGDPWPAEMMPPPVLTLAVE